MLARVAYDLARTAPGLAFRLWPLWSFWFAWRAGAGLWRDYLLTFPDPAAPGYALAYRAWPAAALAGPVLLTALAVVAHRLQLAGRVTAFAGVAGTALATLLTVRPEWDRLAPYLGRASPLDLARAVDPAVAYAGAFGFLAVGAAVRVLRGDRHGRVTGTGLRRAPSDNHGHADWLPMRDARRLFPGPDPEFGGIVVGEAYRVDRDRVAGTAFDPADRRTWGRGGTAPLLVDPCRAGPTHALVLAGSGGYKTSSVAVPTLLTWTGSAVVLDPSREAAPMVAEHRRRAMGHRVATLDPARAGEGGFDALDWIDPASPLAESHVEAVVGWIGGEARGHPTSGAEFFREGGKGLTACLLAHLLWDPGLPRGRKTLRELRRLLVTPEDGMRTLLGEVHRTSHSAMARDLAGTLVGLVDETFSGVYANANKDTRWLSTPAYADLVWAAPTGTPPSAPPTSPAAG